MQKYANDNKTDHQKLYSAHPQTNRADLNQLTPPRIQDGTPAPFWVTSFGGILAIKINQR
jgi:hypothetical protein